MELVDQLMLRMLLTTMVALMVLPRNLMVSVELDDAGFIGSWMVPPVEISSTLAKACKPTVRGVMLADPGR